MRMCISGSYGIRGLSGTVCGRCFGKFNLGKLKTTKTVLDTLAQSFMNRNRVLAGLGAVLLVGCLIASVFRKKLKKHKWTKKAYRGCWITAVVLLLLSLTAGAGTGVGFGDGSGVGIGDGAGAGIGSEVGVGDDGNEGTEEKFLSSDNVLCIRIHNLAVTVDDEQQKNSSELNELLDQRYRDGMSITIWDDYADNIAFLWVVETVKQRAIPYRIERVE